MQIYYGRLHELLFTHSVLHSRKNECVGDAPCDPGISRIKSGFFSGSHDLIKCNNFNDPGCLLWACLAVWCFAALASSRNSPLPEALLAASAASANVGAI